MLLCRAQVDPLLTLRWHTSLSGLKGAPPPRPAGHSATTHRRGASGTRGASPGQGRGAGFSNCAVAEAIRSLPKLTVRRPCGGADTPTRAPQARSAPTRRIPIQEAPPHWEVSTPGAPQTRSSTPSAPLPAAATKRLFFLLASCTFSLQLSLVALSLITLGGSSLSFRVSQR